MEIEKVAQYCHEAARYYSQEAGFHVDPDWSVLPAHKKEAAIKAVRFFAGNPVSRPADLHNLWMQEKLAKGWKLGDYSDELKQRPCLVPYHQLSDLQKGRILLFYGIARSWL